MFQLKILLPFLTIVFIACSAVSDPTPVNASGLWNVQIRKSTGVLNDATLTINQPESDSRFSGFWRFTSVQTSNAQVSGDTKTGVFKINEIGGSSYVDVAGTFTQSTYLGTYKAYYSDNTTATGSITMKKARPTAKLTFNISPSENFYPPITVSEGQTIHYGSAVSNQMVLDLPRTVLNVAAQDTELYLAPPTQTVDLTTGDKSITLEYRQRPLRISVPSTLESYRNNEVLLQVQLFPAADYKGVVVLLLQNLPPGVTQAKPVSAAVNGEPVSVDIPIFSAFDTKFADTPVTLTASSGANLVNTKVIIKTRPHLIAAIPNPSGFFYRYWQMGVDGEMYVSSPSEKAVFRIRRDGSRELIVEGSFQCDALVAAPDGSIWPNRFGFTRIDPKLKTAENLNNPEGSSYCAVFIPDAQKRIWVRNLELSRINLVTQQTTVVPGSANLGFFPSQIVGGQFWGISGSTLGSVNTETLEIKKYQIPGVSQINSFFINGTTVALTDGNQLYTFDTQTGSTVRHTPGGLADVVLLGQEKDGTLWVGGNVKWLRYNPTTKQVTKELPVLSTEFSSQIHVTPDGKLWYVTRTGMFFVDPENP
jgi:hypothetical protein